ncbi:MAG: hypothetical protein FJX57_25265, partial [Alphaproteobacteria bacterium]|nr:hypothetical protein [Alphaproteobacteria bacterium]
IGNPPMDPWLELVVARRAANRASVATFLGAGSPPPDPASARVDILVELEQAATPDIPSGLELGGGWKQGRKIYSGVAPWDESRIRYIRRHRNVKRLKLATRVQTQLAITVPDISATPAQLGAWCPNLPLGGDGVIVGIIDDGCDLLHPNFRDPVGPLDANTRLLWFWDQTDDTVSAQAYGRVFDRTAINAVLRDAITRGNAAALSALGYQISVGAHGTCVMDIAGGNGSNPGTPAPGVAPRADLIFVQVPRSQINHPTLVANCRHVLDAVDFIFDKAAAARRPCVINISLAAFSGPHDGTSLLERGFEERLAEMPGRAIVIAAGNGYSSETHLRRTVPAGATTTLRWKIGAADPTINRLEIWYPATRPLDVTLKTPGGVQTLGPVGPGHVGRLRDPAGTEVIAEVFHRSDDPGNRANQALVIVVPTYRVPAYQVADIEAPAGVWTLELANSGTRPCVVDAWIERDDLSPYRDLQQSRFLDVTDNDREVTIGSASTGNTAIVVGAYNPLASELPGFTAAGP